MYSLDALIPYQNYLRFQSRIRAKRQECILFLEHPPTITSGINAKQENLLVPSIELSKKNVDWVEVSRGGDFTAHEPGQWVCYLHLDLKKRNLSLGRFLSHLEEALVETIDQYFGIKVLGNKNSPGLYLGQGTQDKLVSFGINAKSYFTSFGFAINAENDLQTFQMIRPCGIEASSMFSFKKGDSQLEFQPNRHDFEMVFLEKFLNGDCFQ